MESKYERKIQLIRKLELIEVKWNNSRNCTNQRRTEFYQLMNILKGLCVDFKVENKNVYRLNCSSISFKLAIDEPYIIIYKHSKNKKYYALTERLAFKLSVEFFKGFRNIINSI